MLREFKIYLKNAPEINEIHYWNLPPNLFVGFKENIKKLKLTNQKSISIKKLVELTNKNLNTEKKISFIHIWKNPQAKFTIKLPINLVNENYVKLYALMLSEGSFKTEFRLHVPEKFFHKIMHECLRKIFGTSISCYIRQKENKNVLRTTLPRIVKYFIPIPEYIPKIILKNKKFAKTYLRIAFEAESSPIFVGTKRYIRMTRSSDITHICNRLLNKYKTGTKIFFGSFKQLYPKLAKLIENQPPITLLGEYLVLMKHFGIKSIIKPESIRFNKTKFRKGKISVKWALSIYSQNLNRFIKEIGFLSTKKKNITKNMLKVKGRRGRFFTLSIIEKIQKNNIFTSKDFCEQLEKLKYKSPRAYLWRFEKKMMIQRIGYGIYRCNSKLINKNRLFYV